MLEPAVARNVVVAWHTRMSSPRVKDLGEYLQRDEVRCWKTKTDDTDVPALHRTPMLVRVKRSVVVHSTDMALMVRLGNLKTNAKERRSVWLDTTSARV